MPGVYLSYPFCAQKCSFCNFASGVFPASLELAYRDALINEIERQEWAWTADTVYLGGGTPGSMPGDLLERLLRRIPGRPWREATIEAAPGTLSAEVIRVWRECGINRVSLGVQSFCREELRKTGRRHDAAIVQQELELLRSEGLSNLNVDLIAGLPGQTTGSWAESLDWIEKLQPPHVSVYIFEIDEDSRLGLEILNNGPRYGADRVPPDDEAAELYQIAVDRLRSIGIERYEISNFAKPGFESIHNLKYWQMSPYVGFGADAHSFDGAERKANIETAAEYVERFRHHQEFQSSTTPAILDEERLFLGMRLMRGVCLNQDEWMELGSKIERLQSAGLIVRDRETIRLSDRGVLVSNEVFQEFIRA